MKLVQLYVYIDSADVNCAEAFSGDDCVQKAIDHCYDNFILPGDIFKVSGTIEVIDPVSMTPIQKSWPDPNLVWFKSGLRAKYVEAKKQEDSQKLAEFLTKMGIDVPVANPNAEKTDVKADGVSGAGELPEGTPTGKEPPVLRNPRVPKRRI